MILSVRVVPSATVLGLGLVGYTLDGMLGAGVALILTDAALLGSRLVFGFLTRPYADRRPKKTLRHRYFLWRDRQRRRRARSARERAARKEAEGKYMARARRAGHHR